jgi:hypothetical protein
MESTVSTSPPHPTPSLRILGQPVELRSHASYSFFNRVQQCQLNWFLGEVLQLPERKSGPQFLGLCVHDVLDRVNRGLVPVAFAAIAADYLTSWQTQRPWTEGGEPLTEWRDIDWGKVDDAKAQRDAELFYTHGWELLRRYFGGPHRTNLPAYWEGEPLSEFQLNLDLGPYGGRRLTELVARIDLFTHDGRLLDYKTKGHRKLTQEDYVVSLQPLLYAFMLEELGMSSMPLDFRYGQLVYKSLGKGSWEYTYDQTVGGKIPAWRTDVMRQRVLPQLVQEAEGMLERLVESGGSYEFPVRPGSHCRYCQWKRDYCPLFTRMEEEEAA